MYPTDSSEVKILMLLINMVSLSCSSPSWVGQVVAAVVGKSVSVPAEGNQPSKVMKAADWRGGDQ